MLLQFLLIFDCMLKQKLNKSNPHKEVLYSQLHNNLFDGLCSKNSRLERYAAYMTNEISFRILT